MPSRKIPTESISGYYGPVEIVAGRYKGTIGWYDSDEGGYAIVELPPFGRVMPEVAAATGLPLLGRGYVLVRYSSIKLVVECAGIQRDAWPHCHFLCKLA